MEELARYKLRLLLRREKRLVIYNYLFRTTIVTRWELFALDAVSTWALTSSNQTRRDKV